VWRWRWYGDKVVTECQVQCTGNHPACRLQPSVGTCGRLASAGLSDAARHGKARHSMARHSKARHGMAWHGMAQKGTARQVSAGERVYRMADARSSPPAAEHSLKCECARRSTPAQTAAHRAHHNVASRRAQGAYVVNKLHKARRFQQLRQPSATMESPCAARGSAAGDTMQWSAQRWSRCALCSAMAQCKARL
jgi:hypothetical protein